LLRFATRACLPEVDLVGEHRWLAGILARRAGGRSSFRHLEQLRLTTSELVTDGDELVLDFCPLSLRAS
jgi:hypothetical protein